MTQASGRGSRHGGACIHEVLALVFGLLTAFVMAACILPRGGWELDPLVRARPELETIEGHRLGDMIPFPSLEGNRVVLVACRFPADRPIRVAGRGPGWSEEWAARAVEAMAGALGVVELTFDREGAGGPSGVAPIQVQSLEDPLARGPVGLADTLSECDVSSAVGSPSEFRGELIRSTIRIRRNRIDFLEESRAASAEEWTGALMHELAHALGFSGHTRSGPSILVLEQSWLRAAGRRALASKTWSDPTLEALYAIPAGQRLGDRALTAESISMLDATRSLLESSGSTVPGSIRMISTVGDRAARILWRRPDGRRLGVRFPRWRDELRSGAPVTLVADSTTLRWLEEAPASGRSFVDGGLDRSGAVD